MKKGEKKGVQKLSLNTEKSKKYAELFEDYIRYCKVKNLSEDTIKTYRNHHRYFIRFTGDGLLCSKINQKLIDDYRLSLKGKVKDITINSYVHNISPVLKYGMKMGYIKEKLDFSELKVQESFKDIYTEEELRILLKKPNANSFSEYRNWVIINTLLGTGIRALELRSIKISNVDFENNIISLPHTKNKRARIVPMSSTLEKIMKEYLVVRNGKDDEYLFCTVYGEMLKRTSLQMGVTKYCKKRGVNKYSLHLFRHTFITCSIRKGISPMILQRITGHQSFKMLSHYYNMNAKDLTSKVDTFNPLEDFKPKEHIKIK